MQEHELTIVNGMVAGLLHGLDGLMRLSLAATVGARTLLLLAFWVKTGDGRLYLYMTEPVGAWGKGKGRGQTLVGADRRRRGGSDGVCRAQWPNSTC